MDKPGAARESLQLQILKNCELDWVFRQMRANQVVLTWLDDAFGHGRMERE